MSESFENADCSFTFDTSLSAEFDLTIYAGIIYELAVLPPKQTKIQTDEFFTDFNISANDADNIERDDDVDMNQTHLTEEFNQIFSYFDEDIEQLTDNSDDELNQFYSNFNEFSDGEVDDQFDRKFDDVNDEEIDEQNCSENVSENFQFEDVIHKDADTIFKAKENYLTPAEQRCNESHVSYGGHSNKDLFNDLTKELGVGNVREKVLMYNEMLEKINANLASEKSFFRRKVEENVSKENDLMERFDASDDVYDTTIGEFDLLSKYVKKLSSIESYAQILSRLNRLVNALSQLDKNRLNGMNAKSLKNFLYFIKIYSNECVNMSSAIRRDIAIDLEKNLLTHEDLLYCLDVVANEVNIHHTVTLDTFSHLPPQKKTILFSFT